MKPRPPRNKIHTHTHTYARSHSRVVITEARLIIGRRCWEIMKADPTPATPLGVFFTGHLYLLQSLCLKGKSVRNKLMGGEKKKKKQGSAGKFPFKTTVPPPHPRSSIQESRDTVWCQIFQTNKCESAAAANLVWDFFREAHSKTGLSSMTAACAEWFRWLPGAGYASERRGSWSGLASCSSCGTHSKHASTHFAKTSRREQLKKRVGKRSKGFATLWNTTTAQIYVYY